VTPERNWRRGRGVDLADSPRNPRGRASATGREASASRTRDVRQSERPVEPSSVGVPLDPAEALGSGHAPQLAGRGRPLDDIFGVVGRAVVARVAASGRVRDVPADDAQLDGVRSSGRVRVLGAYLL
jgi:hypothetical protein